MSKGIIQDFLLLFSEDEERSTRIFAAWPPVPSRSPECPVLFPAPYTEAHADEQGPEQGPNRDSTGLSALRSLNRCLEVLQRRMFRLGRGHALTP